MSQDINVRDILNITNGKLIYGNEEEICKTFSKSTKEIKTNDVFVGIKGETFDGGNLYKEALNDGAKGCIINAGLNCKIEKVDNKFVIEVEDTIYAIQQIAKFKREKYNIPVIAVTGSVGKTSTKDIIANVVSQKYKVLKTQGNMNNHIGLPMTILGLDDHTAMVVEMGMNHFGEISTLTNIAKPTIAVITNVGTAHIGILGSRENILKAKLEILEGLGKDGTLIINNDNDLLHSWYLENKNSRKIVTYGINNASIENATQIKYENEKTEYILKEENSATEINVPIGGEAFVYNSLAAISVGRLLKIDSDLIKNGIKTFQLTQMRLEIVKSSGDYTIINDCYNANYDSMKSSINYLSNMKGGRKIAVLGDMLELGDFSEELHKKVGEEVKKNNIDILVTVGKLSKNIAKMVNSNQTLAYEFENNNEAIKKLKEILKPTDVVLIKASNSMHFKEIYEAIK